MAFRFALAPLLRLRQSIERQRTLELQEANLRVGRARESLAQLERCVAASAESSAAGLTAGCTSAELQFAAAVRENMVRFAEELRIKIRELELARQIALAAYHLAYREREVLETLRAQQRIVYDKEQSRREQQQLDEMYLLQHCHHRH